MSITQTLTQTDKIKLNGTVGIKIASDHSDDFLIPDFVSLDNLPLPMPYQTSLGTNDLVLGASFGFMHWNFGIGFQHVIENKNKNRFLKIRWYGNSDAQKYFESNLLDRGDDALVRAERNFNLKKFFFTAGLLGIYRLQKDKINTLQNESIDVIGSDGLTFNLTGSAQYNLSSSFDLKFSFGTPVVVREARPDGLTRELVTTISFDYNF